jgi:hypothetical protein
VPVTSARKARAFSASEAVVHRRLSPRVGAAQFEPERLGQILPGSHEKALGEDSRRSERTGLPVGHADASPHVNIVAFSWLNRLPSEEGDRWSRIRGQRPSSVCRDTDALAGRQLLEVSAGRNGAEGEDRSREASA